MKITLIQFEIAWANPTENIIRADAAINRSPGSDLYIMPEMFSTGFIMKPKGLAESKDSDSLKWMIRKSKEMDAAICGSIAVEDNGHFYNRMYFVKPDGEVTTYDKSHLFIYGGEGEQYTPGNKRVIINYRGINILLEICYDLRFPMWCRNSMDDDGNTSYDLILYSAEWPLARKLAWDTLLSARAIENQCYVAACSCVGADDWGEYFGGSKIIHPYGHILAEGELNKPQEITGEIDMEQLVRYRTKFPTLKDIIWKKDYC